MNGNNGYDKNESDELDEQTINFTASENAGRLDTFLVKHLTGFSRTHIRKIISKGVASINGEASKPSDKVRSGDMLSIVLPLPEKSDIAPEEIPLDIVYEDDSLIVINKQKNLTVHPTPNRTSGTLVNALLYHCGESLSGIGGVMRPGIVHRLDKETSGVIVVAKNDAAHISLSDQIKNREMEKFYFAIVHGVTARQSGKIDAPIGRNPGNRKKMAVLKKGGRDSTTSYKVAERFRFFTSLDIRLHTGRTHQIRVHMAHIGHPVAGDPVYGGLKLKGSGGIGAAARDDIQAALDLLEGQALHARELAFYHPLTKKTLRFTAPLPPDIQNFLDFLRAGGSLEV